jgi:DnaK suppressor protein
MGRADLERFRAILLNMLAETGTRVALDAANSLSESRETLADPADRASQETDLDFTLIMRERDRRRVQDIRAALARLDSGEYGVCDECGEDIPFARLRARPMTTLCVECQSRAELGLNGTEERDDRIAA